MNKLALATFAFLVELCLAPRAAWATDTDGDFLVDSFEVAYGTNPLDTDSDNDNLSDYDEIFIHGTNPLVADTDADSMPDDADPLPLDNGNHAGATNATMAVGPTAIPYAWSGESPQDGVGVYVHSGHFQRNRPIAPSGAAA